MNNTPHWPIITTLDDNAQDPQQLLEQKTLP